MWKKKPWVPEKWMIQFEIPFIRIWRSCWIAALVCRRELYSSILVIHFSLSDDFIIVLNLEWNHQLIPCCRGWSVLVVSVTLDRAMGRRTRFEYQTRRCILKSSRQFFKQLWSRWLNSTNILAVSRETDTLFWSRLIDWFTQIYSGRLSFFVFFFAESYGTIDCNCKRVKCVSWVPHLFRIYCVRTCHSHYADWTSSKLFGSRLGRIGLLAHDSTTISGGSIQICEWKASQSWMYIHVFTQKYSSSAILHDSSINIQKRGICMNVPIHCHFVGSGVSSQEKKLVWTIN